MDSPSWLPTLIRPWWRWRIAVVFLLGLIAVDLGVHAFRATWRRYDPDDYRERVRACRDGAWDVVVVGGSPVSEGIDPARLAGLTWRGAKLARAFNLGLPGATTSEVWHGVAHGIRQPPRVLVYGITASDLNEARDAAQGPAMLMNPTDLAIWWQLRPQAGWWCTRQWLRGQAARSWNLYQYRQGIRLWAAHQWPAFAPAVARRADRNLHISAGIAEHQGYAPRPELQTRRLDQLKATGYTGLPFRFLQAYRLGDHQRYLHRLLDWADANQVTPILVDMPVTADLEEIHFAPAFAQYRTALRDVAAKRGVRLLSASRQSVGLTDADFADLIHLNAEGAARLSTWLRDRLERVSFSQDDAGDAALLAGGRP
jgi:hypothetical protein